MHPRHRYGPLWVRHENASTSPSIDWAPLTAMTATIRSPADTEALHHTTRDATCVSRDCVWLDSPS